MKLAIQDTCLLYKTSHLAPEACSTLGAHAEIEVLNVVARAKRRSDVLVPRYANTHSTPATPLWNELTANDVYHLAVRAHFGGEDTRRR